LHCSDEWVEGNFFFPSPKLDESVASYFERKAPLSFITQGNLKTGAFSLSIIYPTKMERHFSPIDDIDEWKTRGGFSPSSIGIRIKRPSFSSPFPSLF